MKTLRALWSRGPGSDTNMGTRSEAGQGLAEYALILTLIAAVCIAALTTMGVTIAGSPGFSMF